MSPVQKFREAEFLTNDFFNIENNNVVPWGMRIGIGFFIGSAILMILALTVGTPLGLSNAWWGWFSLMAYPAGQVIAWAGRASATYGIPDEYDYYGHYNLNSRARDYLKLTPEERRTYPPNILELIKNPDLTREQRDALAKKMREAWDSVCAVRTVKNAVAPKRVDIDSALAIFDDGIRGNNIVVETYQTMMKEID